MEGNAPVYWMQVNENYRLVKEAVAGACKQETVKIIKDAGFVLITGTEQDCCAVLGYGNLTVSDEGEGEPELDEE